ncbi:MAG: S8 family serine peptidase, partial [Nanoarchaeota archaeon]|nr:S8 family serine peptidase [Nanoarchaeota archaeon]
MEERTEVVGEETGGGGFETIRRRSFDSGNRLSSKKEISCVLYGLNENDLRDRREYSIIDGFSGRVTKDGLNKLRMGVGVKKIYFDYPVKAMLQDSVPLINASVVHSVMVGGVNITGIGQTICVVDTGVDYTHADLGGCFGDGCKVIAGYDFINNDADPLDDNGHGTHVAGIAAASGGITGVASGANIVAVKV